METCLAPPFIEPLDLNQQPLADYTTDLAVYPDALRCDWLIDFCKRNAAVNLNYNKDVELDVG
jgi:hypothetical protein